MLPSSFASAGPKPWHNSGVRVGGLMTVREAMEKGGLDFEVVKAPLTATYETIGVDADGCPVTIQQSIPVTDKFATVRTDTNKHLGVVGSRYNVVQNHAAFDFFDGCIGEHAEAIDTVGSFRGGSTIFMSAKMKGQTDVGGGDIVERYLVFTNSHDGTSPVICMFTPVRIVCQNTLVAALKNAKNCVKLRHTASVDEKLKQAQDIMGLSQHYWKAQAEWFQHLKSKPITVAEMDSFVNKLFNISDKEKISTRAQNQVDNFMRVYETAPGQDEAGDNQWGLFNALTYFVDRERGVQKGTDKFESIMFGSGAKLREKGVKLLNAL